MYAFNFTSLIRLQDKKDYGKGYLWLMVKANYGWHLATRRFFNFFNSKFPCRMSYMQGCSCVCPGFWQGPGKVSCLTPWLPFYLQEALKVDQNYAEFFYTRHVLRCYKLVYRHGIQQDVFGELRSCLPCAYVLLCTRCTRG